MYAVVLMILCAGIGFAQSTPPQTLFKEAMEAQQAGHFDQAVRDYRLLVAQYPKIFEIRSNLGASLAGEGLYTDAIAEYQLSLAIKSNPQVRLNLALAYY